MATSLDKAVSTEDCPFDSGNRCMEAVKLEAVLKALVDHKVKTIKNNEFRSLNRHANPRELVKHLMAFASSSSALRLVYSTNPPENRKNTRKSVDGGYPHRDRSSKLYSVYIYHNFSSYFDVRSASTNL